MERSQLENLSPPDAAVALRSYARRFRELFTPAELRDSELDFEAARSGGWSVRALLEASQRYLHQLDEALVQVFITDTPALPAELFSRPAPPAGGSGGGLAGTVAALDRLADTVVAMADRVQRMPSTEWSCKATVGGTGTDAHELLREAVAYGRTSIDLLGAVLEDARRAAG